MGFALHLIPGEQSAYKEYYCIIIVEAGPEFTS